MKIIDYNKSFDKKTITLSSYEICKRANFPVVKEDVYDHLFANDEAIVKFLIDNENNISGFGVFENYKLLLEDKDATMLYLSGMVIDPKYQGHNISTQIIRNAYEPLQTDLISLRTQNIKMAESLLHTYKNNLLSIPGDNNKNILQYLKQVEHFKDIDDEGVIKDCYYSKLYPNLDYIYDNFGIKIKSHDALGVVIEPKTKEKKLSLFK